MRFHSITYLSPFYRSLEQLLGELVVHLIGNCEQINYILIQPLDLLQKVLP